MLLRIGAAIVIFYGIGLYACKAYESAQCMFLMAVVCLLIVQDMKDAP